jgi:Family of unknown function (DUF6278)
MGISFVEKWMKRHATPDGVAVPMTLADDQEGIAELLRECELLRSQAEAAGVRLDDSAASLAALDQLLPRWREDEDRMSWLGNDAGLYLGTVLLNTVVGSTWQVRPDGRPVIRLASGREVDVVTAGHDWARGGTPELSQAHAEAAEGSG